MFRVVGEEACAFVVPRKMNTTRIDVTQRVMRAMKLIATCLYRNLLDCRLAWYLVSKRIDLMLLWNIRLYGTWSLSLSNSGSHHGHLAWRLKFLAINILGRLHAGISTARSDSEADFSTYLLFVCGTYIPLLHALDHDMRFLVEDCQMVIQANSKKLDETGNGLSVWRFKPRGIV